MHNKGSICCRRGRSKRGDGRPELEGPPPSSRVLGTRRLQDCLGSLTAVASHPSLSLNTLRVSLSMMEWPRQTAKHLLLLLLLQSLPPHTNPRSIPLNFTAPCGQINQWLHLSDFLSDCFPIWFSPSDPQNSWPNFCFSQCQKIWLVFFLQYSVNFSEVELNVHCPKIKR